MSDYWKKKMDELEKETKKSPSQSYWDRKTAELEEEKKQKTTLRSKKKDEDEDDIAPVKSKEDDGGLDFFQKSSLFDDGWDAGDVIKTILGTAGDVGVNFIKGAGGLVEGATDFFGKIGSYGADALGFDGLADTLQEKTQESYIDKLLNPAEDYLDKYSVLGRTSDSAMQGIGQMATILATGGLGAAAGLGSAGVTALTTGTMFASGAGSGMVEAYKGGANDLQAFKHGLNSGAADAVSELIFGGLGKYVNALGFSKGLSNADDMLAKLVGSKFKNQAAKNIVEFGIKAGAEGLEEVIAGVAQAYSKYNTYLEDQGVEFTDVLKDENLLEQFVVGSFTSGLAQGSSFIGSTAKGRDFITGLNQNEQAVVKKEVENRIAEAEADGTKLTAKEKAAIEAQVEKDLEKGYISTDLIEEVVGGYTYKAYKDSEAREDALFQEYEELGKATNPTLAQQYRYRELDSRVKSIKDNDLRSRRKEQLDQFVSEQVNGSRLAESYNEKARRGQAFEADLTKYDAKQQAVIQKAVESGILNNTNRTHEFVDMVAKISADKGVLFDFTNNEKLKNSGFAVDGKAVNGYVTKDGITINVQSAKSLNSIVGHEITHVLEGTDLYTELQTAVVEYAKTKGDYQGRFDSLSSLYQAVEGADINAELTADLVGDYLFTDSDFINSLSTQHRNVFQKIYDEVKYLLKVATAGSKEARELEKVKRAFEKAYRENGKKQTDTKYSVQQTTDGRSVAVVDSDILSNIDTSSWDDTKKAEAKKAAVAALKQFKDGIVVDGITRKVNRTSRREYTRSDDTERLFKQAPEVFADKMRAADAADDIVVATTNWQRDGGLKHPRTDNFVDFDHGKTLIVSGNAKYTAEVVVGITASGDAVFYDVVDLTPATFDIKKEESPTTATTQNAIGDIQGDSSSDNVAQNGESVKYSLREEAPPKETGIAYKVFFVKDGKLYPPMVANPGGADTPMGVWLNADMGTAAPPSKTGRAQVKAGGKGTQGGSGSLAFRPGWHLGDLPRASQFDRVNPETGKKELFPENFVWAEVEYAKDVDYQEEAMSYGYTDNGKFRHAYAGLPRLPENGYYRYRTNPKPDTVPWVITGAMKVNRLLSDAEVNAILEKNGVPPVHRQGGDVGLDKFGFNDDGTVKHTKPTENPNIRYSLSEDNERVFYTPRGIEVVQNPSNTEYRQMREEIYKDYPWLRGTGEAILRHTYDEAGNEYYWNAFEGMHRDVEPYINKQYNTRTSQHWEWWTRDDKDDYPTDYSDIRFSLSEAVEETKDLVALHNLTADKLTKSLELGGLPMPSLAITKADIPHSNFGEITLIFGRETIDPKANKKNKAYSADAWTPVFPRVEYEADSKVGNRISQRLSELETKIDDSFQRDLRRLQYGFDDYLNSQGGEEGLIQYAMDNYGLKAAYLEEQGKHIEKVTRQEETEKGFNPDAADKYQAIMDILGVTTSEELGKVNLKDARDNHGAELEAVYPGITKTAMRMGRLFNVVRSYLENKDSGPVYNTVTDSNATRKAVDDALDLEGFEAWTRNLFSGIVKDSGIYNNKELYTPSGNRRTFKQTHLPVTLENIVKAMASQNSGNAKNVSGFNGIKTLRAATAETFKSVAEMHKRKGRLQNRTQEEADALNDALQERLFKIIHAIDEESGQQWERNPYIRFDTIGETIAEIGEGGKYNVSDIQKAFSQYGREISDDTALEVKQLLFDVTQMPVNIFESKPQRVVSFDEAKVFVIPNNVDVKLKQELLNRGYSIAEYDPNVEGDRQRVVNQFEEFKFSLSDAGAAPKTYGNYNVYGKDVALSDALLQEEVAPVAENATTETSNATPNSTKQVKTQLPEENSTVSEMENVAPVAISETETTTEESSVAEMFPDDLAPVLQELENLYVEQSELRQALESAMDQGDYSQVSRLTADYESVTARIREIEKADAEQFNSLGDSDVPPEMEAPYQPESEAMEPADPFADRDMKEVGKRSVKAYMYENPEVKPFFQEAASVMLGDLSRSIKGEKIYNEQLHYESGGEYGWSGTKRTTTDDIADLLDNWNYTYADIEKGLNAIIEDNGKENNAVSKRIEFMLDYRLRNGYTDVYGEYMPPDQRYIDLLNEKQITEYSREAFDSLFAQGDKYAPPVQEEDIAPVQQKPGYVTTGSEQMKLPLYHDPNKVSPAMNEVQADGDIAPVFETESGQQAFMPDAGVHKVVTRKELHANIISNIKAKFAERGFDLDAVLKKAKNLSTFATVDNTPQRVMEKALGYKEGGILSDITVNEVAQNETKGIKWLNSFTDRKNGLLAQISKQYNIKPGSKESAAAQMYAEGFYVNEQNEIIKYGDGELAADFPDPTKQAQIKGLAKDPRIRKIYDDTLKAINESRARNAYPEIPRLDNYFLHFRAMNDTFSRLGLPFNPNDIRAKDLPTDLNGVTADLKPGQPYFASAQHRTGKRTSFDLLGGLEQYLTSAKNQIYHIDDIQNLRALRNYIADTYGQANGLEGLDALSEEEQQERIEQVYDSHLSTFAKFLNEEANVLAGKTALIDRGLEGIIGRRGMTFLDTVNRQVGANMVGYNVSSSLTNFLAPVQAFAKTNKAAFIKGLAQFVSNKVNSINGNGDGFAEQSPVMIRRKGAERFNRTLWQKMSDPGYALMGLVDDVSTELIARAKYNDFVSKGMDSQQAHIETDKWVSRLMGDRSLGQQPQLYNSKMLGIVTKFQLEVRNQLDSQFYDTIQEAKVSNEYIEDRLTRNAVTAAKVGSTFFQLAVAQHLFGKAFESIAGYNPAFDIISAIIKTFGWDDDEEDEDTVLDNIEQGFFELMGDMPYVSTFTGGRIPISSALPIAELYKGEDQYGNEKSRWETLGEAAPYYFMPAGYGQVKKTKAGLDMFSDEHPIAGSYTDSGNLRFPVEDTLANRAQAAIFGQYASKNARDYFDNERSALKPNQVQEFMEVGMSIQDYWKYRDGLKGLDKLEDKVDYINGLDLTTEQKNVLVNNLTDRKEAIDLSDYDDFSGLAEFDFAHKNPEKYDFLQENGISYKQYKNADKDTKKAYDWAFKNPEKFTLSKAVSSDVVEYVGYANAISKIKPDYDAYGDAIHGSREDKVIAYINTLDIDTDQAIILYRSNFNNKEARMRYNQRIVDYLNGRSDLTYEDRVTILEELEFTVTADGSVYWD